MLQPIVVVSLVAAAAQAQVVQVALPWLVVKVMLVATALLLQVEVAVEQALQVLTHLLHIMAVLAVMELQTLTLVHQ